MEHTRGGSVWRRLPGFVRTSLWSSPLFVYDHGVRSEELCTNAAFQPLTAAAVVVLENLFSLTCLALLFSFPHLL